MRWLKALLCQSRAEGRQAFWAFERPAKPLLFSGGAGFC